MRPHEDSCATTGHTTISRVKSMSRRVGLLLLLSLGLAPLVGAEPAADSQAFLTLVRNDLQAGTIGVETALLEKFHYVFAPDRLAPRYQQVSTAPLRCVTDLIGEYRRLRDRLSTETRAVIDDYLRQEPTRAVYTSPGGRFQLHYDTTGTHAVPTSDVAPADGIPDFVQKVAGYLDQAWQTEFDELGFLAPPIGTGHLDVSFANMSAYGYTTVVDAEQGLTRLVLHNDFEGFPWNDDPEGDVWGAAKVTAAHELKHASQYAGSRWSEGEWIELDAVWVEEMVFDQVNDYYNYLVGESPLVRPDIPLPGPDGAGGSYEDAVFQLWLQQTWGVEIVRDFWSWRAGHGGQSVLASWQEILAQRGTDLAAVWGVFTAWNYGTGYRAAPGLGYDEATAYPHGLASATCLTYPCELSGEVDYLAADFINLQGLGAGDGTLRVELSGPAGAALTLAVFVRRPGGTGIIETAVVGAGGTLDHVVGESLLGTDLVGLVVGNGATAPGSAAYDLRLSRVAVVPDPIAAVSPATVDLVLGADQTRMVELGLSNVGPAGSTLAFQVRLQGDPPGAGVKNVAGSTLTASATTFRPGQQLDLSLTVTNGSTDDEWLTDLWLDLPAGTSVPACTDFMGGSLGDLTVTLPARARSPAAEDPVTLHWHGTYGSQGYGVIRDGESATAVVSLVLPSAAGQGHDLAWTVRGDQFGAAPHEVEGLLALAEAQTVLTVISPAAGQAAAVGQDLPVSWTADGPLSAVDVQLSRDGGDSWETLLTGWPPDTEASVTLAGPPSTDCLVRVAAGDVAGESAGRFTIYEALGWAACTVETGQVLPAGTLTLPLTISSHELAPGQHTGYCVIDHNGPDTPAVVPVVVVVDPLSPVSAAAPAVRLLGNAPNPFNPRTRIRLELADALPVTVDILDIRGNLLRRLHQGELSAGPHTLEWNGRDQRGRRLASGTYLVRVRAGRFVSTRKMMLAK